ncbi:CinA family protein [Halobacteriales archaeon SW_7_68_16]|nr:MAG: CinA family protein [Halobacteriales archaeon SW_7_68_16]
MDDPTAAIDPTAPEPPTSDDQRAVARVVGDRLRNLDATVAVVESCTGGLIGARLTAPPGASDYFVTGTVPYAYDTKRRDLGVARETLDDAGVVSAPVARDLARRVRDRADTTWGLATTGVAGPDGGTETTPVGTVFVGVAHAAPWESGDSYATVSRYTFDGDRGAIRARTTVAALRSLAAELDAIEGRG